MNYRVLRFSLIWITCVGATICAEIIESNRLSIIRSYLAPGCLVICDIDNTLAHPTGRIGSDEWFSYMLQYEQAQGLDFSHALQKVLPVYCEVQLHIGLQPTEKNAPQLLKSLQQEGVYLMSLTARSLPLVNRTITQLAEIGIDFSHNHVGPQILLRELRAPYVYKRGILFSGQNNKGDALVDFLHQIDLVPSRVVFVDDKLKNLHDVEGALNKRGIPFYGIRYSKLDAYVAELDDEVIAQELHAFYHA